MGLRQTGSASDYTMSFQKITSQLDFDESAFYMHYRRGLKDNIKDVIATMEKPSDLQELMAAAVRIDNRAQERRKEKQGYQSYNPGPRMANTFARRNPGRDSRPNYQRNARDYGDPMELDYVARAPQRNQ